MLRSWLHAQSWQAVMDLAPAEGPSTSAPSIIAAPSTLPTAVVESSPIPERPSTAGVQLTPQKQALYLVMCNLRRSMHVQAKDNAVAMHKLVKAVQSSSHAASSSNAGASTLVTASNAAAQRISEARPNLSGAARRLSHKAAALAACREVPDGPASKRRRRGTGVVSSDLQEEEQQEQGGPEEQQGQQGEQPEQQQEATAQAQQPRAAERQEEQQLGTLADGVGLQGASANPQHGRAHWWQPLEGGTAGQIQQQHCRQHRGGCSSNTWGVSSIMRGNSSS